MKQLPAQRLTPKYYEPIQRELDFIFYEIIYKPMVEAIKQDTGLNTRLNAKYDALEEALKAGTIQFGTDKNGMGVFSGKFNVRISKQIRDMGGKLDHRSATYTVPVNLIPAEIRASAALAEQKAREVHDNILRALDKVERRMPEQVEAFDVPADRMLEGVNKDFYHGTMKFDLNIAPDLSDDAKLKLDADYNQNMKLYIKKWSEDHIKDLREMVEYNGKQGYRYDSLFKGIKDNYGVSQRKAEFLARQETGLFVAKFRKVRLGDAGVTNYKWSGRSKTLTRPDHWALQGMIFSYNSPPIVDRKTGRRGNPGEDFGCLCADIPILGRVESTAREAVAV